jgi:hypothetical protein
MMFDGIFARMYLLDTRDHRLPHLHAKNAEFEASIGLGDRRASGRSGPAQAGAQEEDIAPETLFAHLEPVEVA